MPPLTFPPDLQRLLQERARFLGMAPEDVAVLELRRALVQKRHENLLATLFEPLPTSEVLLDRL